MTIEDMRALLGLGSDITDAQVLAAYGAYSAASSTSPVPLETAKLHLGVTFDTDDDLITDFMAAAVDLIEGQTGLVLSQRTVIESASGFEGAIRLRAWPVASVDRIVYHDLLGVPGTLDPTFYRVANAARPARVVPIGFWPRCHAGHGSVLVTMTAGFASEDQVPRTISQAVLMLTAEFYANREVGALSKEAERSLAWLLRRHKVHRL